MPQGIQVNDASGTTVFDTGSRLYRILTVRAAGNSGSFTHAAIANAAAVAVAVQQSDGNLRPPVPRVSGSTVSWSFSGSGGGTNDTSAYLQILLY